MCTIESDINRLGKSLVDSDLTELKISEKKNEIEMKGEEVDEMKAKVKGIIEIIGNIKKIKTKRIKKISANKISNPIKNTGINTATNHSNLMRRICRENNVVSSFNSLAENKSLLNIDSKLYGIMLSYVDDSEEYFLKKCKEEYEKEYNSRKNSSVEIRDSQSLGRELEREWNRIRNMALKYYQFECQRDFFEFNKKKRKELNGAISLLHEMIDSLSFCHRATKYLNFELGGLCKDMQPNGSIFNNIKSQTVSISTELEGELFGGDKVYDKELVIEDIEDMLDKIKNKLFRQLVTFSATSDSVGSAMNLLPDNYDFSNVASRDNIFYQISEGKQDSEYLYKVTSGGIYRSFWLVFLYPFHFFKIDSILCGCRDAILLSSLFFYLITVCNILVSYIGVFFIFVCFYYFFLAFIQEHNGEKERKSIRRKKRTKLKKKRKKRRKRKRKVGYFHTVGKSLKKIYHRLAFLFFYKKSKIVKVKRKKRKKRM